MNKNLLIIDGSSLMYRAFFALPALVNKSGVHTGAVYGFITMLMKHLQSNNYDYICVTFDKSRITFRNEIYKEYKATRQPTPPELSEQFNLIRELLEVLGIHTVEMENYEADDIIGTYAQYAKANNINTTILSGDRDLLQLLDEQVVVALTKKGISEIKKYTPELFQEDYVGLMPKSLIDIKALMGDSSDNIPGISGVGEKTALKLLAEYKTLENVLNNATNIKGKLGEKILNGKDIAIISQQLATINTAIPISINLDEWEVKPKYDLINDMFQRLEFRNMQDRMPEIFKVSTNFVTEPTFEIALANTQLLDSANLPAHLQKITKDTDVVVVANYIGEFPLQQFTSLEVLIGDSKYMVTEDIQTILSLLLSSPARKVGFDFKTFYQACFNTGIVVNSAECFFDVAVAAYLLDATVTVDSLEKIYSRYLNDITDCNLLNIRNVYKQLVTQIEFSDMNSLFRNMEMPLSLVLAKMELEGISIDQTRMKVMAEELSQEIADLEKSIQSLAGEEFNVNSPKQIGAILFDKLNLPIIKKTKTGYSTDIEVLEKLESYHAIIPCLIQYRTLTKLYSTYLEGLNNIINPITKKIHTHFQQTVTSTGRLSSTQPNLQNIPVRTPLGRKIRGFFVPSAGYDYLLSCDYSQIELRVLAHMSQDAILIDAFRNHEDIHMRTAAEVFHTPLAEVSPEMRSRAKAVNFGIVYGISDYGLSQDLKITRKEAQSYIEKYFERYQGIKKFMDDVIANSKLDGFVQTMFNRQRYLPDINSSNFNRRSFAERTAVNTPIQGTAADIIKLAMLAVDKVIRESNLKTKLLLQVHDELLLEVPANELDIVSEIVVQAMQNVVSLSVDLEVSCSQGKTWADCK